MSEKSLIKKAAEDFAAATLKPVAFEPEKTATYTVEAVKAMADKGFLKVADMEEAAIVAEAFGYANASMAEVAIINNVLAQTIEAYNASLGKGGIYGYALYEEGDSVGSGAKKVVAVKDGDAYKLTGEKFLAYMGGAADQYVVIAQLDEQPAAFVVDAADIKSAEKQDKLGLRSMPTAKLVFDGAKAALLSADGAKVRAEIAAKKDILNIYMCAGVGQIALETSVEYAKTRVQFGAPIAKLPAVQFMLADIATAIYNMKAAGATALALCVEGKPYILEAAMAKKISMKAAYDATTNALQIHGGTGYSREHEIERYYRDVKGAFFNNEYSEYAEKIVAADLLK